LKRPHRARTLMIWGTSSDAGKSLITTGICRILSNQGLKVAPYKAQNMSNNARVATGGEIGCAQWFQAKAARREPHVSMNPVLLKPERATRSQVVLLGQANRELTEMDWRSRSAVLREASRPSLLELLDDNDVVVAEGAGSPAEINLSDCDYVNLDTARLMGGAAWLVSDIDRGGALASCVGTWALLTPQDRSLLQGFLLNRFRGDRKLLEPAPQMLQDHTGVPVTGVVPRFLHDLPDEDAASWSEHPRRPGHRVIALCAYPQVSNFDEFQPLSRIRGWDLVLARSARDLEGADIVLLPGSKNSPSDLLWLRCLGMDKVIVSHAQSGRPVIGICGGLQILGCALRDPHGVEGEGEGLGLLPLDTTFGATKRVVRASQVLSGLSGCWSPWNDLLVAGYEIRMGSSAPNRACVHGDDGLWFSRDNVFGTYLHGFFENREVCETFFGSGSWGMPELETTLEHIAEQVASGLEPGALDKALGL
jgi:adenosylcobyric acid synthase